jgi:hypothetical protein
VLAVASIRIQNGSMPTTFIDGEVIRVRVWNTDIVHRLPQPPWDSAVIGTSDSATLQVSDPTRTTAGEHAVIERDAHGWMIRELAGEVRVDGVRRLVARLDPGTEVGIGGLTFVAESRRWIDLRCFMARLLGWESPAVDLAMRALRAAVARRARLVLCGPGDVIALAHAIHRRQFDAAPFVASDPRRRSLGGDVRSCRNFDTGSVAMRAAIGGSIAVWSRRLPADFDDVLTALRDPNVRVQLIVCSEGRGHKPYHVDPIVVPALADRAADVPRIIDEFADEEMATQSGSVRLHAADRDWILRNSAATITDIEKGVIRLTAIRNHPGGPRYPDSYAAAARYLGMEPVSLIRWIGRRALPERVQRGEVVASARVTSAPRMPTRSALPHTALTVDSSHRGLLPNTSPSACRDRGGR